MLTTDFKKRRETLNDMIAKGIAIIPSAKLVTKSNDTEFPFRQNSNFKYLTGYPEHDAILVLTTYPQKKQILFVRERDPFMEMWTGRIIGPQRALEMTEVDETYPINEFEKRIGEYLVGHESLYMDMFDNTDLFMEVRKVCQGLFKKKRTKETAPPLNFFHLNPFIEKMRLIKDQTEVQFMKLAMEATNKAHRAAMAFAAPGKTEKQVEALMQYIFNKDRSEGNAYDNIVAGGDNANILHYIENNQELNDGELLLIDAGSELNLYATDITRTFPINGTFTGMQKEVYSIVLEAQKASLAKSKIGSSLKTIHEQSCRVLAQGLIDLKVLDHSLEQALETQSFREFYPHGTGHWLGLDVHDQNPYQTDEFEETKFEQGVIFTVEPGLYFPKSNTKIPSDLRGIGVRIEDNILITDKGYENLSSMIPKEIKDVELACKEDYRDFIL